MDNLPYFITFYATTAEGHTPSLDPMVSGLITTHADVAEGLTLEDLEDIWCDWERYGDADPLNYCTGDTWVVAVAESPEEFTAVFDALKGKCSSPGERVSVLRRLAKEAKHAIS